MQAKISLITGANGGLGTHVSKAMLEAGFTVIGLSQRIKRDLGNAITRKSLRWLWINPVYVGPLIVL